MQRLQHILLVVSLSLWGVMLVSCDDSGEEVILDASDATTDIEEVAPPPMGVIAGVVSDVESGQAIAGTSVCVIDTEWCTTSGLDGRFELTAPQGPLVLVASEQDYRPSTLELTLDETADVTLLLLEAMTWSEQQVALGAAGNAGVLVRVNGIDTQGQAAPLDGASLQMLSLIHI